MKLRLGLLAPLLAAAVLVAPAATGQTAPSVQDLAGEWVRGRYGSPLICQMEGESVRGMRRLHVTPGPSHVQPPTSRIIFVRMEVEKASRCFSDLEKSVPNIEGSLQIRMPGAARRDTANRDFKALLRREGGLEFEIASGVLRLHEVGASNSSPRDIDFAGGTARFSSLRPGTDADRLLASIRSPRKLGLLVTATDGSGVSLAALPDRDSLSHALQRRASERQLRCKSALRTADRA